MKSSQIISYDNHWIVKGGRQINPTPFCIIGILNITPDSFSDGGRYLITKDVIEHTKQMLQSGAQVIDIGAESTRPFAEPIIEEVEKERLIPHFKILKEQFPDVIFSIDTYKAFTAKAALELGADIINDVSGCTFEPNLLDILVEYKPGFVLCHTQGKPKTMQVNPSYKDIIEELLYFFESQMSLITKAGLPEDRIVLDPGIGFGKKKEHTEIIMKNIERLKVLGRPLYIGLSRKSFFKQFFDLDVHERDEATRIATALLAARGVRYHRVHDVAGCTQALKITEVFTPFL
ncbi:dihydropteroate synthase [Lawsonia intracellularis]|uniref:dihydropteroate synthase n=1 Tax=Lawsonia intracellularis TaxID=29546 RepID=UPI000DE1B968|nr:dihydropteroate synthase [Lawsonia intracellularis]KAA0205099.1 dihydropteroate synthase [Lawsonia intracellularis]MBZ3892375.1 dihydropteroate synthase [Lawsonia intracellularis]RBN33920.1 dihydropteroate synthase [Lawsonia intracellularis]RBN34520.1 dihydropteroate synthase [Lawsonia intracellularis]UYH53109.1 dihydropteroate synthase [Lawsonia intracellularis]